MRQDKDSSPSLQAVSFTLNCVKPSYFSSASAIANRLLARALSLAARRAHNV